MNDIMLDAYNEHTFDAALQKMPLFADSQLDWKDSRHGERGTLKGVIRHIVEEQPGKTRSEVWQHVVLRHFMQFRETEFRQVVAEQVERGVLECPTPRRGNRLNDNCILMPGKLGERP
jgi:hypothetical protein